MRCVWKVFLKLKHDKSLTDEGRNDKALYVESLSETPINNNVR